MSRVSRLSTIIDYILIDVPRCVEVIVSFVVLTMLNIDMSDGIEVIVEWIKGLTRDGR